MKIEVAGRWVLLLIGLALVVRSIFPTVPPGFQLTALLVFGFLGLGLGAFGPDFMVKYGEWLDKISDWLIENPSKDSYEKLFKSVASGKMPGKLVDLAMNYALSHPIEGMQDILASTINITPENKRGRKILENALQDLKKTKEGYDN